MAIPPVTSFTTTANRAPSNTLGKQDFLNLLIQQMRNQDPMDPMKGTEFAAQLAQFSSLEQLTNLNDATIQGINANIVLTQSINNALSTTFIGKTVRAGTDTFQYNGEGDSKLAYELDSAADSTVVKIYDENDNLVKTFSGDSSMGENIVNWDGTNEKGETVPSGKYHFNVEVKDSDGKTTDVLKENKYIYGTVNGVRFKNGTTVFVIDGMEVALSSISEISGG
jgi:flagellar basal-body rod modification protein FlgD